MYPGDPTRAKKELSIRAYCQVIWRLFTFERKFTTLHICLRLSLVGVCSVTKRDTFNWSDETFSRSGIFLAEVSTDSFIILCCGFKGLQCKT